jgi:hypothetical protein
MVDFTEHFQVFDAKSHANIIMCVIRTYLCEQYSANIDIEHEIIYIEHENTYIEQENVSSCDNAYIKNGRAHKHIILTKFITYGRNEEI